MLSLPGQNMVPKSKSQMETCQGWVVVARLRSQRSLWNENCCAHTGPCQSFRCSLAAPANGENVPEWSQARLTEKDHLRQQRIREIQRQRHKSQYAFIAAKYSQHTCHLCRRQLVGFDGHPGIGT